MGKHTKLKPPAEPLPELDEPADDDADLGGEVEGLLRRTHEHLCLLQSSVQETLAAGTATPALARESASVARAITSLAGEVRQWEKHERAAAERMTPDEIDDLTVSMILDMPIERQEAILDRLQTAARGRGGVLV